MTNILRLTCPIDDLEFDVSFLQEWSDYMATWGVGVSNDLATDVTIECPNAHKWAINFQVTFQRTA